MNPTIEPTQTKELAGAEIKRLHVLENKINRGLATFLSVGESLQEIRDARLYRATNKTFEQYCHEKWGFGRSYAARLIAAATVTKNLLPTGNTPASETVARPLADLPPRQQVKAWEYAMEHAANGTPTAREVTTAVKALPGHKTPTTRSKPVTPQSNLTTPTRHPEELTTVELIALAEPKGRFETVIGDWRITVTQVK